MSITTPLTGTLSITFISASGLPRKQLMGKQDPYVRVHFGEKKLKSKVHENGDKTPEWNDTEKLELNEYKEHMISFKVKNDNLGRDDDIAVIRMPIYALLSHQGQEREYPLFKTTKNKSRAGSIKLKAELKGTGGLPTSNGASEWGIESAQFGSGSVQVDVKGYLNVKASICQGVLHFKGSEPLSAFFGFDPLDSHDKALKIKYMKQGVMHETEIKENHSETKIELAKVSVHGQVHQPVIQATATTVPIQQFGQMHVQQPQVQQYGQPQPVYAQVLAPAKPVVVPAPQPVRQPAPKPAPKPQPVQQQPTTTTAMPPFNKTIYVKSLHTGNFLQNDEKGHARTVNTNKMQWEAIVIKPSSSALGKYIITSQKNGHNLQCTSSGECLYANKNEMEWEQWSIEAHKDRFFLRSHTGKMLQVQPDGTAKCENGNKGPWEALHYEC